MFETAVPGSSKPWTGVSTPKEPSARAGDFTKSPKSRFGRNARRPSILRAKAVAAQYVDVHKLWLEGGETS